MYFLLVYMHLFWFFYSLITCTCSCQLYAIALPKILASLSKASLGCITDSFPFFYAHIIGVWLISFQSDGHINFVTFTLHMGIGSVFVLVASYFLIRLLYRRKEFLKTKDPPEVAGTVTCTKM